MSLIKDKIAEWISQYIWEGESIQTVLNDVQFIPEDVLTGALKLIRELDIKQVPFPEDDPEFWTKIDSHELGDKFHKLMGYIE